MPINDLTMGNVIKVNKRPKEKPYTNFLKKALQKWYLFAISITVCLVAALAIIKTTEPVYQIGGKLLIAEEGRAGISVAGGGNQSMAINGVHQTYNALNEMSRWLDLTI
ncbi:MAG: hypothetical protein HC896_08610 [Bacteroidales bacterium]|nr:hypothetical protein [Bacteroidales bacterium]